MKQRMDDWYYELLIYFELFNIHKSKTGKKFNIRTINKQICIFGDFIQDDFIVFIISTFPLFFFPFHDFFQYLSS